MFGAIVIIALLLGFLAFVLTLFSGPFVSGRYHAADERRRENRHKERRRIGAEP